MNILLDENLPTKLKFDFSHKHRVLTVRALGWNGKKNGELLRLMVDYGIDLFVTMDKNLQYQQNLSQLPLAIILLDALNNKHQTIQPLIPLINSMIDNGIPNGFHKVVSATIR